MNGWESGVHSTGLRDAFMISLATLAAAAAGLTALMWLTGHISLWRAAREIPVLTPRSDAVAGAMLPAITLLVAAKDEEDNIERCLRSVLMQEYPDLTVVAIDDRSSDRTGEILDRLAATDRRLTSVHVHELPTGWFGKSHAMHVGVSRSRGEWLCFTDADCALGSPHSLATAVRHVLEQPADFLSVLPVLDTQSLLEQMMQPACSGILLGWFNPLWVNDPRKPTAYANGALMLIRRDAYEKIGGHEAVRAAVAEDIELARRAKRAGLRLRVAGNDHLYSVRMYSDFAQVCRGWTRIFHGAFGNSWNIALMIFLVLVLAIGPWLSLGSGLLLSQWADTFASWRWLTFAGAAAVAAQISVQIRYYRSASISVWLVPTYPLAAAVALVLLATAIRRLGGRGVMMWRGTAYQAGKVASP